MVRLGVQMTACALFLCQRYVVTAFPVKGISAVSTNPPWLLQVFFKVLARALMAGMLSQPWATVVPPS
jgi:hypothetical protein